MAFGKMGARGGFGSAGALGRVSSSAAFVPDTTPSAYRTTTQTMIAGRTQTGAIGVLPSLSSEFSINCWWRHTTASEGFVFNFHDQTATTGAVALGGGSLQAMALYFSGGSIATASLQNKFYLTGTDKTGNHIAASTVAVNGFGSAYGYITTETQPNTGNRAALLTVQYRSGNIELWITYRGMAPRLLIQQACTWTGTSSSLPFRVGVSLTTLNSTGTMEFEMPIVLRDRSISQNEIAQLADGVSPENLNAASAQSSASIKFGITTSGTTTAPDRCDAATPVDSNTLTLNSAVYTFRTAPSLGTDLKVFADITINQAYATDGTLTFASSPAIFPVNGQRVALGRSVMPSAIDPRYSYYIVNANSGANTYQLALTLGGAALTFSAGSSSAASRLSFAPQMMDDLCTQLNALTPNSGGASNATYEAYGSDTLIITHRTAGGTSFTFDCNATNVKMPTNKRLALAWAYITDYLNFSIGLLGDAGFIRRRSAVWPTPSGTTLAPNTQVTGSMRINSWTDGMVTNSVNGTSYLDLDGIYTGNDPLSGGQIKFYDQNGGTQVQDFTALTGFSINSGAKTWSGKLTVPIGKRWCAEEAKKTGSTQVSHRSEVRFGFGLVVYSEGRSHTTAWFNDYATNDLVPTGFSSQFNGTGMTAGANGFFPIDNCWHVYDTAVHCGAGAAAFCNTVSDSLNACVALISRAIGGQVFVTMNDPAVWALRVADVQNTWGDASLMPLAAACNLTFSSEDFGDTVTGLLPQFRTALTTYFGAACKLGVTTSATYGDAPDSTVLMTRVRGQQIDYKAARLAAGDTSVYDGGSYEYDRLNTADGTHSGAANDHKPQGESAAIGLLGALSGTMNTATGPTISSIIRTGANIDITWNLNGATALQVPNVGTSIRGTDVALTSSNFLPLIHQPTADNITDTLILISHGWANGDPVAITHNSGSVPAGINLGAKNFIVNATANTYQLSATVGGAAINFTTNGSNLYAYNIKNLLGQTSHTITGANTTRIVLAAGDPGASVMVMHGYGRPGKQIATSYDPNPALDTTGRTAMTELWGPTAPAGAQGNFLNDNYPRNFTNTTTIGRLAEQTSSPITVS